MVYRIFVEKKPGLDNEARALENDAKTLLGIRGLKIKSQLVKIRMPFVPDNHDHH